MEMETVLEAWNEFISDLRQLDMSLDSLACTNAVENLCEAGCGELVIENLLEAAKVSIQEIHLPNFWSACAMEDGHTIQADLQHILPPSLSALCQKVNNCCQNLKSISDSLAVVVDSTKFPGRLLELDQEFRMVVGSLMRLRAPFKISVVLESYFKSCLDEFSTDVKQQSGSNLDADGEPMDCPENEPQTAVDVMGKAWVDGVRTVSRCLRGLNLGSISDEACTGAVCENVSQMLADHTARCSGMGCWAAVIPIAKHYLSCIPMQFLKLVLHDSGHQLRQWGARLECFLYESLGDLRIEKLFDMAVDFPASTPAVTDLCECLNHTTLESRLLYAFRAVVTNRLLHGGASTSDIINHFNLVVRMLGEIDPSGFLLEKVSEPYRQYLRGRQDTMKCIVTILTNNEEGPSMLEEFSEGCTRETQVDEVGEDDEMALQIASSWDPSPVHIESPNSVVRSSVSDVISTLVGIYGSNDMFIEEYRKILGDRLLSKTDYDCICEIQTVELLKIRFGESALHNCEVMLRDMHDSRRMQQNIKANRSSGGVSSSRSKRSNIPENISATIISELFWPELNGKNIKLPPGVQKRLDSYSEKFHSQKAPRKLRWKTDLGLVDLDVTVGKTTLSFSVTPAYAVVIVAFQTATSRMANDLAREVGMTPAMLRAKALFWVNNGVLVEGRGRNGEVCYRRADEVDKSRAGNLAPSDLGLEEEGPSTMVTGGQDTDYESMRVFESYTIGYLTNYTDGRSLDQIHRHMRNFVIQPKYDRTQDQLENFLARLVDIGKITHQGGLYRLKRRDD